MFQSWEKLNQRWLLPSITFAVLVLSLLFLIPYTSGYGNTKVPLGIMLWNICMNGQNTRTTLDFSYCLFVPFIVGYLVFTLREEIAREDIRGSNAAMGLIGFGLLLYWFGLRAEMQVVGYAAMQLLLAGVILWLWGWAVFKRLLFPWAFFIFFWPVPFLDSTVAFPLRMIMSHLAYGILNFIDVPTVQNGTALLSAADPLSGLKMGERFRIDIADPCSGIRSLLALMMISALYAYLVLPKLWQQWLVFLSSVPLTIVGNLARVLILIAGSILFGSSFAIGTEDTPSTFHEGAGFMVYGVALGLEFLLGYLLMRDWGQKKKPMKKKPVEAAPSKTSRSPA
jgi:exosortase